ncbi:MAG: hypothetical protein JHC88_23945, partial [Niveispirillum sp.]|nr:hypothetical protein [Niveispirillum sp.]
MVSTETSGGWLHFFSVPYGTIGVAITALTKQFRRQHHYWNHNSVMVLVAPSGRKSMADQAIAAPASGDVRKAGIAQAIILVISGFLPILAIVSLTPAVPTILDHFKDVANASLLVPVLVSAPA